jgi:N,N'-diacetyllegionaminate synthase
MKYIAEIGLNHLGSSKLLNEYEEALNNSSVDAISIQIREDSFYDHSKAWKVPLEKDAYINIFDKSRNKELGLAVGDYKTAKQYAHLNPDFWKVLSWGIKDNKLLQFLTSKNVPIYISTGLSSIEEIKNVAITYRNQVKFIHTQLSDELCDVNLNAISSIKKETKLDVAFGLHCSNLNVLNLVLPFYPDALFFYTKVNNNEEYPDNTWAILLHDIDSIIAKLNKLKTALGTGLKVDFEAKTLSADEKPDILHSNKNI